MFRTTRSLVVLAGLTGISLTTTIAWAMGWVATATAWANEKKVALMSWIEHPSISDQMLPVVITICVVALGVLVIRDL